MDENRKIKRGEIYWIEPNPYRPSVGSVQQPGRPGIVVSNDSNNLHANTFEIVYITTSPKKDLPTHCTIRSAISKSTALCEQINTVSIEQIGDFIGECTTEEMDNVDICMTISLGIDLTKDVKKQDKSDTVRSTKDAALIKSMAEEIKNLTVQLARAEKGEELMKELYAQLLESRTKKRAT